jgi:mannose-6-phosphate isomerase-like protein (cupin superfamily)
MPYTKKFKANKQFSTPERCDINELLNHQDHTDCSIAQAIVAPGVTTQLHALKNTIERYIIIAGTGNVFIDHSPAQKVSYLDVVTIPADTPQKIQNNGHTDLIFLCICTPRFIPSNYRTLEEKNLIKSLKKDIEY